jgi:hypothetical protein
VLPPRYAFCSQQEARERGAKCEMYETLSGHVFYPTSCRIHLLCMLVRPSCASGGGAMSIIQHACMNNNTRRNISISRSITHVIHKHFIISYLILPRQKPLNLTCGCRPLAAPPRPATESTRGSLGPQEPLESPSPPETYSHSCSSRMIPMQGLH